MRDDLANGLTAYRDVSVSVDVTDNKFVTLQVKEPVINCIQ